MAIQVRIEREWGRDGYSIFITEKMNTRLFSARPAELVMEEVSEYRPGGEVHIKPFLTVDTFFPREDFLAALAKELARLGFRETKDEEQLKDVLKVKDEHLQDMRTLVFEKKP